MAENINALILPIGADPSQFKESLNSVKAAFKDLSAKIAGTQFNLVTDKQKEQLSGLERTFKALGGELKNFGKDIEFPANSIAGITRKIDELNKRKISLDATTSAAEIASINQQLEKLVAKKTEINSLGKTLVEAFVAPANSIAGLDKRISDLNKKKINLDAKTSAAEIARLTKEIEKLTSKRDNIDALGSSVKRVGSSSTSGFKKTEDASKDATRALTSLSLVAQDLPFGFIGIQNNLPAVLQTFSELSAGSKGLKGALSQIGTALVGPAGLFLAFSVVTSAITFAIKEYGSLTNAVKVLFGASENAVKSQNDYNKAVLEGASSSGSQIAKINILVATIQNENTSQKDRLAAYRELKRINPDIVAGIDEQNLSTAKSIKLIGENAKVQLEFIKLQIKAAGISKALDGLEKERFAANGKYNAARAEELKLINFIAQAKSKDKKDLTTLEKNTLANENNQLKAKAKNVKEASDAIADITKKQENWTNSLTPTINRISQISSGAQDLTDDLKNLRDGQEDAASAAQKYQEALAKFNQLKIQLPQFDDDKAIDKKISSLEKYGNIVLDTTNYDFERAAALKEIIEIDKEYFKNLDLTKTKLESLQTTIQNYIGYLYNVRELQKELAKPIDIKGVSDKIDTKIFIDTAKLRTDVPAIVDLLFPDDKFNKITEAWNKINKDTSPKLEDLKNKIRDALISKELITGVKSTYEEISNAINSALSGVQIGFEQEKKLADTEKQIKAFTERINNAIEDGLRRPLRDFFDTFLDTGKFAFDSFVKLAKDSFKRIAADLLASGLAKLLTSFLLPMAGGGAGGGLVNSLMSFLPPSRTRARFESMGQRRDGIGGQVNFVIRGTELVGVLNRGNQEINRIG
jgi:hypothetical protein